MLLVLIIYRSGEAIHCGEERVHGGEEVAHEGVHFQQRVSIEMCVEEGWVEEIAVGWLFGSFTSVFPFDLYMSWKALAGSLALRAGP